MRKIRFKVSIVCILALICTCIIPTKIFANSINVSSPNRENRINVQLTEEEQNSIEDNEDNIKDNQENIEDNEDDIKDNQENIEDNQEKIEKNTDDSESQNINQDIKDNSDLIENNAIELSSKVNRISIKFPENQTTGSHWYCEIEDEKIAKVVFQGYSFNSHVEEVVGQSKIHTWTIEVLKPGITNMVFTLKKPLNKDIIYDTKKYKINASDINNVVIIGNSFYDETTGKYIENSDNVNETILQSKKEHIKSVINEMPDVIIDEDSFDEVNVKKNDIVAVKLEKVAGSDYKWHYYIKNDDNLEFINDAEDLKGNKFLLNGCVINHYWIFKATGKGKMNLKFKLYKNSQDENELIRMYKFAINIVTKEETKEEVLPKGSTDSVAVR